MRRILAVLALAVALFVAPGAASADDGSGCVKPPVGDYGLMAR